MRFAYIDSQGNEVAIPSVDALALRIELGAIGPDTELYDAQADRWGPAKTHEIFHTLSRESEDDGFVAPPPPVSSSAAPSTPSPEEADEVEQTEEAEQADEAGTMDLGDLAPDSAEPAPVAEGEGEAPSFDLTDETGLADDQGADEVEEPDEPAADAVDLDFTLADETPVEEPSVDEAPVAEEPSGGEDEMSFDLAGEGGMLLEDEEDGEDGDPGEEESGTFDFGGMDTLEMEESPVEEEVEEEDEGGAAMDFGGGMEMEEPLSEQSDFETGGGSGGGDLELEQPMSEFSSDSPPAWMEQDGPAEEDDDDEDGAMDFRPSEDREASTAGAQDGETRGGDREASGSDRAREEEKEPRDRPRSRPSPPRRKKQRSLAGPLVGIVVVAVVAGGGYFGWQALQGRAPAEEEAVQLPPVTIPDIPAELLPTMRDLGEEAMVATVDELNAMQTDAGLPAEPRDDWLSGVYLANASQFPDVQEYWEGIDSFVDRVRDRDSEIFHQKYQEALAGAGIAGDTASMLLERADSGFLATRQDRSLAYDQMDDLVDAALDLHDFLLTNEGEIAYDPAAGGMSADPVLEAVPSSQELGDEMWDRVDRITEALDQLGTLDRVTTERLLAVLFDRIRRAGFQ
jgi:hypothetical protein